MFVFGRFCAEMGRGKRNSGFEIVKNFAKIFYFFPKLHKIPNKKLIHKCKMNEKELIALENEFIRLRNQGKTVGEIVEVLDVSKKKMEEWESSFQDKNSDVLDSHYFVSHKDNKGQYLYSLMPSFIQQLSSIEKLEYSLFLMARPLEVEEDIYSKLPNEVKDSYERIQIKAKEFLGIVKNTIKDLNIKSDGDRVDYTVTATEEHLQEKAVEIVKFYLFTTVYRDYYMNNLTIINTSPTRFFHKPKRLPYALKQLQIQDFNGIKQTGITDLEVDSQWIFLTGENTFGKTAILQAIVVALLGNKDDDRELTQSQCKIGVEIYHRGINEIYNLHTSSFTPFTNFVAYGSSRLEIANDQSRQEIKGKSSQTYSLFNPDGVLLNIEPELSKWSRKNKTKFAKVKQTLLTLLPYIEDISVNEEEEIEYIEKETAQSGLSYKPLPFDQLSAGNRNIIAMIGDMMLRLFSQQSDINDPSKLTGIAIIDELDLHLHPKWQRKLPSLLSKVFPKVQFIVSTHSVVLITGAPKNSIFLKVNRNKESGIQIKRIEIDTKNLLPNALLTSPIFDLEDEEIVPATNQAIDEIKTEDFYEEVVKDEEIKKRLLEFEESNEHFPDELFVNA